MDSSTSPIMIRRMQSEDLIFAAECTRAEGWHSEDLGMFQLFHQYDPEGCLIAEKSGQPVGICVAISYGHYGFIGELIVLPKWRGQGIGALLLQWAINYLHKKGARTIYLDGVLKAVALYERHGFKKVCHSLRYHGFVQGKEHAEALPMQEKDLAGVCRLDYHEFGADRSFFIVKRYHHDPDLCKVLIDQGRVAGYIQGKRYSRGIKIGPWVVVPGTKQPDRLVESLMVGNEHQEFSLGCLESNTQAVGLLSRLGFQQIADSPWRMVLGNDLDLGTSIGCLAIGSPAKG